MTDFTEKARELIGAVRSQNWKRGGALEMDVVEAEERAAKALSDAYEEGRKSRDSGASFGPGSSPSVEPASGLQAAPSIPSREVPPDVLAGLREGSLIVRHRDPTTQDAAIRDGVAQVRRLAEVARIADERVGRWLSAALDDPEVCQEMKDDINALFEALEAALGIEARSGETHSGSTSGESPTPEGERPDNPVTTYDARGGVNDAANG